MKAAVSIGDCTARGSDSFEQGHDGDSRENAIAFVGQNAADDVGGILGTREGTKRGDEESERRKAREGGHGSCVHGNRASSSAWGDGAQYGCAALGRGVCGGYSRVAVRAQRRSMVPGSNSHRLDPGSVFSTSITSPWLPVSSLIYCRAGSKRRDPRPDTKPWEGRRSTRESGRSCQDRYRVILILARSRSWHGG